MASDLGWSLIATANDLDNGLTRQIFFAKYINWVVAFPATTLALGLVSGLPWATLVFQVFIGWFWILTYLSGAYTTTNYKWGFFAFGTVAWFAHAYSQWLFDARRSAARLGSNTAARDHTLLLGWLSLLWLLYPIAYGLSDGGNKIGLTAGFIFFGILDVLMVPLTAFAVLVLSRRWDYNKLNIVFTQYGRVAVASGHFQEKDQVGAAPAGPVGANGATSADPAAPIAVPEGVVTA